MGSDFGIITPILTSSVKTMSPIVLPGDGDVKTAIRCFPGKKKATGIFCQKFI
jgi:hypothetical protein